MSWLTMTSKLKTVTLSLREALVYSNSFLIEQPSFLSHLNPFAACPLEIHSSEQPTSPYLFSAESEGKSAELSKCSLGSCCTKFRGCSRCRAGPTRTHLRGRQWGTHSPARADPSSPSPSPLRQTSLLSHSLSTHLL